MGGGPRTGSAHFDRCLRGHPFLRARDTACLAEGTDRAVLHRGANILKPQGIKLDPGPSQNLPHDHAPYEITDRETVRFSDLVDMVSGDQGSCARHVLHYKRGIPGDVPAEMPGKSAGVGVKRPPGRKSHDDSDGLSLEKVVRSCTRKICGEREDSEPHGHAQNSLSHF